MKSLTIRISGTIVLLACALCSAVAAEALNVSLAEPTWNGTHLPEGQQCQRFGGEDPHSPALQVTNIPKDANALILEFSDRDVARMDKGGHGKVGYRLDGAEEVTVPAVPGHTDTLPEPFFVVEMHQAPRWDVAGAYLPPCSGGRGNNYFIDVKAVKLGDDQQVQSVIASASVRMAVY